MATIDGIALPSHNPECPQGHGPMVLREPPRGHTKEQQWCGVWFDCAPSVPGMTCASSVLIPSPELAEMAEGRAV